MQKQWSFQAILFLVDRDRERNEETPLERRPTKENILRGLAWLADTSPPPPHGGGAVCRASRAEANGGAPGAPGNFGPARAPT